MKSILYRHRENALGFGKTIRLYLPDGTAGGAIVAEIINWTGQIMVVPRAQLYELAKREELQRTGVYLLIGTDSRTGQEKIYIGEGDDVFARLRMHDKDESKEFWTRAISVTSKDFNFTKAHGRYLESRLIESATKARRAIVVNGTSPIVKVLPESDVADMEYFLEQVELILPVLGVDALRPPATLSKPLEAAAAPLLLMNDVGASATAKEIDGRFVVLRGSTARRNAAPSWDSYVEWRDGLVAEGKLAIKDEKYFEFTEDVEFSSPSAAAAVVAAANRNGRITWRLEDGRTYAAWKESQLNAAEHSEN